MRKSEEWRDVVGYEGLYQVSNFGNMRSVTRMVKNRHGMRTVHGIGLCTYVPYSGYTTIGLRDCGPRKTFSVHRLVLEAFIGSCPDGMCACHWDGDRSNNILSNLRWDTPAENSADAKRHGTRCIGELHGRSKLSNFGVRVIRRLLSAGDVTHREIGEVFGDSRACVGLISTGVNWAGV